VHKSLRVNGEINVTRSLGDKRLKGILSAEPDIATYRLNEQDRMLVLATDGLWSVLIELIVDSIKR
jgi:serine/threonine protein phosphatase PrpC